MPSLYAIVEKKLQKSLERSKVKAPGYLFTNFRRQSHSFYQPSLLTVSMGRTMLVKISDDCAEMCQLQAFYKLSQRLIKRRLVLRTSVISHAECIVEQAANGFPCVLRWGRTWLRCLQQPLEWLERANKFRVHGSTLQNAYDLSKGSLTLPRRSLS